ncbi:HAD hydrolase-like protein [Acinetobacter sp. WZC-1]|uniref:HAD hydrolase-like protein n=1 Tax=Acinetobacter sp. WZC-1 TaxID=3459034 RepID=UPI00403DE4B7
MFSSDKKPIIMFDMDGTLLDLAFDDFIWNHQLPAHHASTHQYSPERSHAVLYELHQQYKHTLSWYSSKHWTAKTGVDVLKLQYDARHKIRARPGCFKLLNSLKLQGYRCWLLTNADLDGLNLKLATVNLQPYFDLIISSEEMGYAKESVQFWQMLHKKYAFEPEMSILVDDTLQVLNGAEAFGIKQLVTILQPSSSRAARNALELEYPAIGELTELLSLLQRMEMKESNVKTA